MAFKDSQPRTIYLKDYQSPDFLIDKTELYVDIRDGETHVTATLDVRRNSDSHNQQAALVLHGLQLELLAIAIDGVKLSEDQYSVTTEELHIPQVPDAFSLTTEVKICPEQNTSLEGLYKSRTMYCTQCEAEGFRKITWYLDRPDVMSEFTTTIEADKAFPVLLSNGNLLGEGETEDGRHWAKWHDPFRKPSYLFALVAGDLGVVDDSFTTCSGREIALRIFVEEKDLGKCAHAMNSLKNAMRWDEEVYGREYDLDIFMVVAVDDFNMGAMENKGLNIFNTSCVLAAPETTTDAAFQRVEGIVAHEYFHNWSGNRVTCRDWFQLSLKEGFTVFRDAEFSADMGSRTVKRVEDVSMLRTAQFAEDGGPTAHPVQPASFMEISNFYTLTIYRKGAEVVRMIHTLLGPELFRQGSDLYFERHDGQAATIEDFVAAMADVSGRDFSQFMNWYRQAGTPRLEVTGEYDAGQQSYQLHFKQQSLDTPEAKAAEKQPFLIPVTVGLVTEAGDLPLSPCGETQQTLEITQPEQTIVFENIPQQPVPSILRGFSAPVKLSYPYSLDDNAFLMSHDSDGFNRWDAGQRLAVTVMQQLIEDYQQGRELVLEQKLVAAFKAILADALQEEQSTDKSMLALILTLPTEAYLSELAEVIHVEAIHHARQFARAELGKALADEFLQVYQQNHTALAGVEYQPSAEQIGQRSLKNLALAYLVAGQHSGSLTLVEQQLANASNMTDTLAALNALLNDPRTEAQQKSAVVLEGFYQHWINESLVVNQWFQVQALCSLPEGLQRVQQLMEHEAFDIKNPNKVRAVIGAFCSANPVNFHCADGAGYQFLADQVLTLDKLNPQIASRLLAPLSKWRRYPEDRQQLMQAQLERIVATPELSKDVYEIARKSL